MPVVQDSVLEREESLMTSFRHSQATMRALKYGRNCTKNTLCQCARHVARAKAVATAYSQVQKAIRRGLLAVPTSLRCVDCGDHAQMYDHRNYSFVLDVVPVCAQCNTKRGAGNWDWHEQSIRALFGLERIIVARED